MSADVTRKMRRIAPSLVAAALAIAYLIVQPTGADLPAQLLRAKLFGAEGFGIWNNWWYGGHYVTAYSVLFPPLAWLTSPQLIAALASVGTAAAFEALAHDAFGADAWLGATWFGAATVTELLSGRLTFALGLCGAIVTALLLARRRPRWAAVIAALTTLASPVAGLFAALAGAILVCGGLKRRFLADIKNGIGALSAAIVPLGVLAAFFPAGGRQPFAFGTLWPLLLIGAALAAVAMWFRAPSSATAVPGAIVDGIVLYLAGCLAAFAIHTPVGANAARLGELVAGPLAALLLVPRRAWLALALAAVPLIYVQVHDAITDLSHGSHAGGAAYYRPLIAFLRRQPGVWRVEVPFTAGHWESYRLAPEFPLARGWERQLDIEDNPLFYDGRLTADSYEAWLHRLAVRYVAVSDAPADYSARRELALIRGGLRYLHVVSRMRHWTVYAVSDPTPIATGAGRALAIGANSLTLTLARPGSVLVRVRWSPYWKLSGVRGCVEPAGSFTRVQARGCGRAQLRMAFSLGRVGARSARCTR